MAKGNSSILIIKYGGLGDVLRTSYILPGLKKKFDNKVDIDWVTSQKALPLIRFNPYIREIFVDLHKVNNIFPFINKSYDWLISLDDDDFSISLTSHIKHERLTGAYKRGKKLLYSHDSAKWFDMGFLSKFGKSRADQLKKENQLTHTKIFEEMFGIRVAPPIFFNNPKIHYDFTILGKKNKGLKIGLNLSSGKRWLSKRLRRVEAKKLFSLLVKHGNCFLLRGREDYQYNKDISDSLHCPKVILVNPISLYEFADLIKQLNLLITSDSLALHLAISQGVKNVSFYAPTSAAEIDTFGTGKKVISTSKDYCSYRSDADNSSLTADRIYQAASKFGLW